MALQITLTLKKTGKPVTVTIRRNGKNYKTIHRTVLIDELKNEYVQYNHKILRIRPSLLWYMADEY